MTTKENKSDNNASEHSAEKATATPIDRFELPTNDEYNIDLKERFEKKYNCSLIKYDDLPSSTILFKNWLSNIARYGNVDSIFLIFKYCEAGRYGCRFYTDSHSYHIAIRLPTDDSRGYAGCISSTRKYRVGEMWNRGNDLPDGKYLKKTFNKIEKGIIRYELKNLQLWRK